MRASLLPMLLLLGLGTASAHDGWVTRSGQPVPETPDRRAVDGFAGHLLITADKDWEQKWNTPPETTPEFTSADSVQMGGELQVLIFFSNPRRAPDGNVRIRCDLQVIKPDGSFSMDARDLVCFEHPVPGNLTQVFLTEQSLRFVAEPGDPPGRWTVLVVLRDTQRDSEVPLRASFELKPL